ncbi:TonB-dependent receptor [Sphaerotilus sp.]|uniref:TonB-dependent siderophore receptor n=1 Tax=Sphaerotilus sp. TaxID=2093942 RepID=UPI002ACEE946|nr:TonB-dependent receptor [Sphaerotilus sp.]MDZ7855849.1 TonB-dependent receptor [Sphaerotilus sp.]
MHPHPHPSTRRHAARTHRRSATSAAACAALMALALQAPTPSLAQPATGVAAAAFELPALPLDEALARLARQAGLQLVAADSLAKGKTGRAVPSTASLQGAVDRLLQGTGLRGRVDGKTLVIEPAPVAANADEVTLPTIKATAKATSQDSSLSYLTKQSANGALGTKSVLDTPFSVTVVDSEQMLERGAKSIGQIFFSDPSVYTPTSSRSTDWWGTQIRGLGVRNNYIDDIPVLLYWGGDFPTEVVESVTALKGLTGFMYGFGDPGGALSYKLKRPTKTPETSVTVGYSNPRLLSAQVDTSHNFGDELGVRANLATEQGTAYNTSKINRTVASVAVDKQFGAALKWQSTLVYEDSKTTGEPLQFYFDSYDVAGSGGQLPQVTYDYDKINVDNAYYKTQTLLAATGVEWRIDDQWSLKAQVGFSRKDHRSNKAFANLLDKEGDYSGAMYNFAGQLDTTFTQAMLQGTVSVGGMKHELVGGLGLQRSTDKWGNEWYWENDFNGNLQVTQTFVTTRTPDFSLTPVSADTRQSYAFLSDTVHLGQHWQAIAGLRFTHYDMKDLDGDPSVDSRYQTRKASPTLALIYKPDAQTSLYGSYVEGLEAGSRVGGTYANAGELLGATVSKQSEVGVKHQSGAIDYSAAVFRIQRANQMDVLRGSDRYLTQDGQVLYQGLELSGAYQATRNLNLGLGAIYLDASIDKVSVDNAALAGNTPANAPKWQVIGNAQYRVPGIAGLKVHGSVRYFGATYVSDNNLLSVPARTVANAGLSYDFRMQGQDLTLFANLNNVFNQKYWASGGWSAGNVGEARNLSVTVRAQF